MAALSKQQHFFLKTISKEISSQLEYIKFLKYRKNSLGKIDGIILDATIKDKKSIISIYYVNPEFGLYTEEICIEIINYIDKEKYVSLSKFLFGSQKEIMEIINNFYKPLKND